MRSFHLSKSHRHLAEKQGFLSSLSIYSPCRRPLSPVDPDSTLTNSSLIDSSIFESPAAIRSNTFTEEEITLFERRYENGYDVVGDSRYREWLCQSHPNTTLLMPFTSTSVQKYLDCPPPPAHIQSQKPKSCGRVLTSAENLKIFEEKERLKKQKEDAKKEREEARRKKGFLKSLGGIYNCVHIVINNNNILTFELKY